MGLLGNLFGGLAGAGSGWAGAHNALLAELALKRFSDEDRARVAEKVVSMGLWACNGRMSEGDFCEYFNRIDRICQLNLIALALDQLNVHILPAMSWQQIKNPFAIVVAAEDIKDSSFMLLNKYGISSNIGYAKIDIYDWIG